MAAGSILLKGGTVIQHGPDDAITTAVADILIEGNTISKIAPSVSAPGSNTRVIDCSTYLISPGFVDTHRHTWQSQLKGRHLDQTLWDYIPRGNMACAHYDPSDVFWGTLAGALESIDAGTTFIVAHEHMVYSSEHMRQGLEAFRRSGIRAAFCPAITQRVKQWNPKLEMESDDVPAWWEETYWALAEEHPWEAGRVRLGLAYDSYPLGREKTVEMFERARKQKVQLITSHSGGAMKAVPSLQEYSLLGPDILISHANSTSSSDADLLRSHGGHISSTPSTELQMPPMGFPICFKPSFAPMASLGVDCNSLISASLATEARLVLQSARAAHNQPLIDAGKPPKELNVKAADVFNLATIKGARAVGLGDSIGSVAEGKLADLVLWDKLSPGMCAAAEQDPVAAIIAHSSPRDVVGVIVDGVVRKESGALVSVEVEGGKRLEWRDVAKELLASREKIQGFVEKMDYPRIMRDMGMA